MIRVAERMYVLVFLINRLSCSCVLEYNVLHWSSLKVKLAANRAMTWLVLLWALLILNPPYLFIHSIVFFTHGQSCHRLWPTIHLFPTESVFSSMFIYGLILRGTKNLHLQWSSLHFLAGSDTWLFLPSLHIVHLSMLALILLQWFSIIIIAPVPDFFYV